MGELIRKQSSFHLILYLFFGLLAIVLMVYYLSNTIIHFTTGQQFPINSFKRFPLSYVIFPAEVFSFLFSLYFMYNLLTDQIRNKTPLPLKGNPPVALLLPVYNEPKDIVERTIKACRQVRWRGDTNIYILDDSSEERHKKEIEELALKYHCHVIRRSDRKGYKAGNINNALKQIHEEFFVILDSDQAPQPEFLEKTMDHFSDRRIAFVQTPQHFINQDTPLERAVSVGTDIFYQSMCVSKANDGALPFCGTNVVVRAEAFKKIGGFAHYTATEDIDLGIRLNAEGYKGIYVPEIMAHGYAPRDFTSYSSQQYRWANGNLAILKEHFLKLLSGHFSLRYLMHTFFTLGWWLIGIVSLIYVIVPILSLFFGLGTHHTWLPNWLLILLYLNVAFGISMIFLALHKRTSNKRSLSDAFLQYSLLTNSMFIYIKAALSTLIGRYVGFVRTNKERKASSWRFVKWNILLSIVTFVSSIVSLYYAMGAQNMEQFRSFFPLSLWLLFYSLILGSSILFVGRGASS